VIEATPHITVGTNATAQEVQTLSANVTGAEADAALTYAWISLANPANVLSTASSHVVQTRRRTSPSASTTSDAQANSTRPIPIRDVRLVVSCRQGHGRVRPSPHRFRFVRFLLTWRGSISLRPVLGPEVMRAPQFRQLQGGCAILSRL
jgi:hypothetical protein